VGVDRVGSENLPGNRRCARAPLQDPKWIYEPKFDGFRGVLYLSRDHGPVSFAPLLCRRRCWPSPACQKWPAKQRVFSAHVVQGFVS
jgi:hypothetical protein